MKNLEFKSIKLKQKSHNNFKIQIHNYICIHILSFILVVLRLYYKEK